MPSIGDYVEITCHYYQGHRGVLKSTESFDGTLIGRVKGAPGSFYLTSLKVLEEDMNFDV